MVDVGTETDIERLRQAAVLLEYENKRLYDRLQELCAGNSEQLALEVEKLKQHLANRNRALFGRSSEKGSRGQGNGSTDGQRQGEPNQSQRGHGPTEQPELPIEQQVCELDEADKQCPSCGGELAEMDGQFEESEEIDVVERSFKIIRRKRKKYRCACGSTIETAPAPARLIPGGRYSVGFAVEVAIEKYLEHSPLCRQVRQMARQGLKVTSQTLWDQLLALARHLQPTYQAVHDFVLGFEVVGADETTWQLMAKSGSKRWWVWSVACEQAIYYRINPSRSAEAAGQILRDYRGVVVCDGYSAYQALKKARGPTREGSDDFVLAHCWAHARRKFIEAEPFDSRASEMLELMGSLYAVEAEAKRTAGQDLLARRSQLRQERSREIVAEIRGWMLAQRALPESALGRAIRYTDGVWSGLCQFLENPAVPIDNSAVERGMRSVALGRKNHYGSRSLQGTEVAALFYSLVESAKLAGLEPAAYLREATRRAIEVPGTVTLPRDLAEHM